MSKLESAFSKAMREQSPKSNANSGTSNESLPGAAVSAKSLTPSKSQIRNMSVGSILSDGELAKKRFVYPGMKDRGLLNIYRNLRTKLLGLSPTSNFTTLVTSVVPCSGSSLISTNIAATFAFDEGKTALLIEGNVLSPSLVNLFDLEDTAIGLMEYLESDTVSVSDILYETGISRLRFIPTGKILENSAEHFTSRKMEQVISEVRERYPERYPIIDAPSINESADTRILLDLCDQVILVIPYGKCSEEQIRNAALVIGKEKLCGVVLNQF